MQNITFQLTSYFQHFFRGYRGRRGYGIHSPFAFSFVKETLYPKDSCSYYSFKRIEKLRSKLIESKDYTKSVDSQPISINYLVRTSAATVKDAQMLFRIAKQLGSKRIIELGTSLGLTTSYLASISTEAIIVSIDHNQANQNIASDNFKQLNLENIDLVNGKFSECLPAALDKLRYIDFAFIDGDHTEKGTLENYKSLRKHIRPNTVMVFHDIRWSKGMNKAWNEIINDNKITASFETYNIGIIFFDPDLNKQHYYV